MICKRDSLMIVTCPNCSRRYMLDNVLLSKKGRQVRCVACQQVWRQVPDNPPSVNNPPFKGIMEATIEPRLSSQKQSSWVGWIVFLAIVFSFLSFLSFGRNFIVKRLPQTEKLYALVGLPTNPIGAGLSINNAASIVHSGDSVEMVRVVGDILNTSDHVRPIPPLKIKLLGETSHPKCLKTKQTEECVLDYWEHRLPQRSLLPGESTHFETD